MKVEADSCTDFVAWHVASDSIVVAVTLFAIHHIRSATLNACNINAYPQLRPGMAHAPGLKQQQKNN